ncbi:Ras-related protein Rab-43 [Hypsibius exemplaris]|uniref:Ras-related protein Rab-43 n=1 Tax=Hypsibius exemplaris TaxID=2072580 RepID=A0A1W0XA87_HYPEX|nr:Ras-related protein Rab-43 [Hypsibius exemplaris]
MGGLALKIVDFSHSSLGFLFGLNFESVTCNLKLAGRDSRRFHHDSARLFGCCTAEQFLLDQFFNRTSYVLRYHRSAPPSKAVLPASTNMAFEPDEKFDFLFKVVLIGDAGIGKTCIVQRFKSGNYVERQGSTIGVDFTMKTLVIDKKRIKLQIWDTAGQERFRTITQSYYRSANGVIVAYDITKRETFLNVNHWCEDVLRYAGPGVSQVLVGCKCDLDSQREVPKNESEALADGHNMLAFLECSAKDNTNVDSVFETLAKDLMHKFGSNALEDSSPSGRINFDYRSKQQGDKADKTEDGREDREFILKSYRICSPQSQSASKVSASLEHVPQTWQNLLQKTWIWRFCEKLPVKSNGLCGDRDDDNQIFTGNTRAAMFKFFVDPDDNTTLTPLTPADIHCNPGALTDTFGFLIQLALGGIAFAFLIIKRYCEARATRRPWLVWSFDTSKQIIASFVTHFGNLLISEFAKGDPCSWYFINFLLDSTVGVVIIILGLRFSNYIIVRFGWTILRSGEYGSAGYWSRFKAWVGQVFVYCAVSTVEKCITASFMVSIWKPMQNLVIWPHVNPKLEVAVVLLIVPFVVNVIVFWVIDNLLMRPKKKTDTDSISGDTVIVTSDLYHPDHSQAGPSGVQQYSETDDDAPLLRPRSHISDDSDAVFHPVT